LFFACNKRERGEGKEREREGLRERGER